MTVTEPTPWWEWAARAFELQPRRFATPGALAAQLDTATRSSPALEAIDRELVELTGHQESSALAIYMPAQEGKSERVSRRYPEWLLDHDPSLRIVIVSYELDIALRWGRAIKNDVATYGCPQGQACEDADCRKLHIEIRRDTAAAGRWETPQGGGVYCVGIGGPLTGMPANVLIVDDPVKDRAAAESAVIRKSTWEWWESVALTRLAPGAKVALIQTRWHEDDLGGRIASRPSPLPWKQLTLPAIAGPDDPLGREPGEELQSVRGRVAGYFANLRANLSNYVFASLYQQTPTAAEGNFFRRAAFRYWRTAEPWQDGRERITLEGRPITMADCWRFATVDPAASTKQSADYTVCAVWMVTLDGDLVLLDRRRAQIADQDHFKMVADLRARWHFDTCWVEQSWWASTLIADARNAGIPVAGMRADKDKITRATPAAGRVHAGKVWFPAETSGCECGGPCATAIPRGAWLDEWCDELAVFDKGTHDDQVDVLAYAARVVTNDWTPTLPPNIGRVTDPHAEAVRSAASAATGDGHRPPDLLNIPLG